MITNIHTSRLLTVPNEECRLDGGPIVACGETRRDGADDVKENDDPEPAFSPVNLEHSTQYR